jgi:hypothetical protein
VRSAVCTLVAVVALLAAASVSAEDATLPGSLVGCWKRAAPAVQGLASGVWTLRLQSGGLLAVYTPGRICSGDGFSTIAVVKENILRMKVFPDCGPKYGLYRWAVSATRLTLQPVSDTCSWRAKLFTGIWTKTSG